MSDAKKVNGFPLVIGIEPGVKRGTSLREVRKVCWESRKTADNEWGEEKKEGHGKEK